MTNNNMIVAGVAVVAFLAVVTFGVAMYNKPANKQVVESKAAEKVETTDTTPTMTPTVTEAEAKYKDGTYEVKGDYRSPAGPEEIDVTLTLKDGVVTDAKVVGEAKLEKSKYFQGKFISGFKPLVVGKKIAELSLDKVSGSSLTPKGFNDALTKVKDEARI